MGNNPINFTDPTGLYKFSPAPGVTIDTGTGDISVESKYNAAYAFTPPPKHYSGGVYDPKKDQIPTPAPPPPPIPAAPSSVSTGFSKQTGPLAPLVTSVPSTGNQLVDYAWGGIAGIPNVPSAAGNWVLEGIAGLSEGADRVYGLTGRNLQDDSNALAASPLAPLSGPLVAGLRLRSYVLLLKASQKEQALILALLKARANALMDGSRLSYAGRAVTKHPEYFGFDSMESLSKSCRTPAEINSLAEARIEKVLSEGTRTTGAGGRYPAGWTTYTMPDGNAASWSSDGSFIGFRGIR